MKNILVTGGAGFIGANLIRELVKKKSNNIVVLDNFSTGRLNNIPIHKRINYIEADIVDMKGVEFNCFFDEIYHLACPASPPAYQKNPIRTMKTNVIGTLNIAELARKHSSRLLFTSTSEVYGDPLEHPQSEGYWGNVNPNGIRSCYDEGKRAAESLLMDYHRKKDLDVCIIRIFNTYGPMMDPNDGRVVSNFINQAIKGTNITIYGDGTQTRSFQYVTDLVDGLTKAMKKNVVGPINLGNPNEMTLNELSEIVLSKTNSTSKVRYFPLPGDDPTRRQPDVSLAKKKLNWSPKISLEDGLDATIEYFESLL